MRRLLLPVDFMLNGPDILQVEVGRSRHNSVSLLGPMRCFFVCISKYNAIILLVVVSSRFLGSKMTTCGRMYERWSLVKLFLRKAYCSLQRCRLHSDLRWLDMMDSGCLLSNLAVCKHL